MNIFLIGMMGSGKTSVGKKLAKALGYQFFDTDQEIEKRYKKTVRQIFEEDGEEQFRAYEKECLNELILEEKKVIATGGGLPCYGGLMELIIEKGTSVYLKADASFLASRLKGGKTERPLIAQMNDEELIDYLDRLLKKRELFYGKSQLIMDAKDLKIADLVLKINEN